MKKFNFPLATCILAAIASVTSIIVCLSNLRSQVQCTDLKGAEFLNQAVDKMQDRILVEHQKSIVLLYERVSELETHNSEPVTPPKSEPTIIRL